jgi:PqqD family protein of HPr-rel-A system
MADAGMLRWRLPPGQRLAFEELDDGIVVYDALVGGTHLVSAVAAEALTLLASMPGLTSPALHALLLDRLALDTGTLPLAAVDELLRRLAALDLAAAA